MKTCDKCGSCYDDAFDLCAVDGALLLVAFAGARVVGGRYRLEQRLDSGSMGTVYRAVHQDVGSAVAVKVINPEWSGNALIEARFRREAQLLGQIKHPNAVLVIDFGVDERGMDELDASARGATPRACRCSAIRDARARGEYCSSASW